MNRPLLGVSAGQLADLSATWGRRTNSFLSCQPAGGANGVTQVTRFAGGHQQQAAQPSSWAVRRYPPAVSQATAAASARRFDEAGEIAQAMTPEHEKASLLRLFDQASVKDTAQRHTWHDLRAKVLEHGSYAANALAGTSPGSATNSASMISAPGTLSLMASDGSNLVKPPA